MSQPYDVVGDAARIARSRAERRRELAHPPGSVGMADRHLRALGAELEDALAASKRHDWASLLEAVRMIQGRAGVTRATLERRLGSAPTGDDPPPLVRAVRAVGLLITEGEVDSLPPEELRVRMHAVLGALDSALSAFLQASE
jgi:hypothetical protein